MANIRLIVADLDGTVLNKRHEHPDLIDALRQKLERLKGTQSVKLAINTGRDLDSFKEVFQPLLEAGINPDFVIVKHAYIFSIKGWRYVPHLIWNIQVCFSIFVTTLRARVFIKRLITLIMKRFNYVRAHRIGRDRVVFQFRRNEDKEAACYMLRVLTKSHGNFMVTEHFRELALSTIPFTKGVAVINLARHLGITREATLCIGDGHNDISMLDGAAAAMTACPANASLEVMQTVHKSRGHIASRPGLDGTLEAIEAHETDTVSYELPAKTDIAEEQSRHKKYRERSSGHHKVGRNLLLDLLLAGMCCLSVLLAMASAKLFGPFSAYLMIPVDKAAAMAAKWTANIF